MARSLMFLGAGSDVGKSVLVAGLCRAFARRGLTVRPFKPQNMSNNAAITEDGREIGRAQALQARASFVAPHADFNPVLLKPESERGAQVVVQGQVYDRTDAAGYHALKPKLLPYALESFRRLEDSADLILVEGAGGASEVNLRKGDIANLGFAEAARLPAILIGDIDRGGVIAQIVGAHALLPEADRALIKGFLINKFRGDPTLFDPALELMAARTGWSPLGLVPWLDAVARLPAEDAMALQKSGAGKPDAKVRIAVAKFSRIANFDDFDPLRAEPHVDLVYVPPHEPLPLDADLIVLPGSKSTRAELDLIRAAGWDIDLAAYLRRDGRVLGICAGYQILGRIVEDPDGIESTPGATEGLGHLDTVTRMGAQKRLEPVRLEDPDTDMAVSGYEMHMGETDGRAAVWLQAPDGRILGRRSDDGRVRGCYVHGLFAEDRYRQAFLESLAPGAGSSLRHELAVEAALDEIAEALEAAIDLDALYELADDKHRRGEQGV